MTKKVLPKKKAAVKATPHKGRVVLGVVLLFVMAGFGLLGRQWQQGLTCERIEVAGLRHAEAGELIHLAQVDTGMVLFEINPDTVADRVQRHPWVREATVVRLPTGTLKLEVIERTPVILALDRGGRPVYYLDREGFQQPLTDSAVYDVPLLRGLGAGYQPLHAVEDKPLRGFLEAFADAGPTVDALVSEVAIEENGLWVYTTPVDGRDAIPVRLGRTGFDRQLKRLEAFWEQAVLPETASSFRLIDLRFDSQIITR